MSGPAIVQNSNSSFAKAWMKVAKTGRIGLQEHRNAEWITLRFPEGRRLVFHLRELELMAPDAAFDL
jgi:hypothetical protein